MHEAPPGTSAGILDSLPGKDSGITNDANLWATETMGNPNYPLELFLRVVTVGLETMITTPQRMFFSHAFGAR
jgi:hypothetical protein